MSHTGPVPERLVEFWMGKAVEWGQALTPSARHDVALHLDQLRAFLRQLVLDLRTAGSTLEVMRTAPFVGQFLGRLCWNTFVTADKESRACLLQCLHSMYSVQPQGCLELKANQWIQNVLCHLLAEEDSGTVQTVLKHVGWTSRDYHSELLRDMVALLVNDVRKAAFSEIHTQEVCPCDRIHGLSVSCILLVTCPEAAPLIGALLDCPSICPKAALSEAFLHAVNEALLNQRLVLEERAVVALWSRSLVSLERAVLHLLESALSDPRPSMQELEEQVTGSLLPRASALSCPLFLVVNDIFRAALRGASGNQALRSLLQAFTCCFLQARGQVEPQDRLPLTAFFPSVPVSVLMPLVQRPTDLPEDAWPAHLVWISRCLQMPRGHDEAADARWRCGPFDSWLLLVQNGHWVDVAGQLLVKSDPQVSAPLVWLLMFYHHPDDNEHRRTQALAAAEEALLHLRALFCSACPPPPPRQQEHIQVLVGLLTAHSQHPSTAGLLLRLSVSFCAFSEPVSAAVELLDVMKVHSGLVHDAITLLASFECGLTGGEADPRLRRIRDILRCVRAGTNSGVPQALSVEAAHSSDVSGAS
ncbi:Fanconi anemia group C protein isoform X2 [Brienomyrus brachyistius]|uniref:Fanconi anemia group C protein isoform X2 n=1 Tax=Brienomyrus brachyistius TaxID=42636 RepID=UPI0020B3774C|nr:Fanconi anemia group C protein isoform X2 [Brienomyrus brachyistius]